MRVSRRPASWVASTLAGALLVAAAVAGGGGFQSHPSQATVRTADTEAPGEVPADDTVKLVVAPLEPTISSSNTEVQFSVLLENSGERTLPDGSIQLSIGERIVEGSVSEAPAVVESDDSLLEGSPADSVVIATETVAATSGQAQQEIVVTVQDEDLPFTSLSEAGVYSLFATYKPANTSGDEAVSAFSPIVWRGANSASASVNLTLIVPFVLSEEVLSMPTRQQLADAMPGFESLLDYATEVHAILAIDPRIIAAIRGYGAEAPESSIDFLRRLERSTLSSFLLQYGDADVAAQAALGNISLLEPAGFEFLTRFGTWPIEEPEEPEEANDGPEGSVDAEAGAETDAETNNDSGADAASDANSVPDGDSETSADPEANADELDPISDYDPVTGAPTPAALGAWPNGLPAAWPAPGQASESTLSLMRSHGLGLAVLNSENVQLDGGPRATLLSEDAIITDAELDTAVALALRNETESQRALGIAQATARLIMAADLSAESGRPTGLVLGVDRGGIASEPDAADLLRELTDPPLVRTVSMSAQAPGTATLFDLAPGEERTDLLQSAVENEPYVLEARTLLLHPEYLDSYQRMRLLTLFGTRYAADIAEFAPVAKRFAERDSELHDGVQLVGTKHTQLVGGSSRIPIQLRNALPFDVVVNISVAPMSAALSVPERHFPNIVLPDDSSDRVLVPVDARVSSGQSALLLSVTSIDNEFTTSTDVLPISISTTVETIAISVLGSAALLLFGFGIWRSVRRRSLRSANGE